jgi:hypothetical protein
LLTYRELRILRAADAAERERGARVGRLRDLLFPQQLAFVDDPERLKAALCSRRAGKSVADASYLFQVAEANPGTLCLFACITRDRAKSIMWDGKAGLKTVGEMAKLGLDERNYNESDLTCWLPNGSRIRLFGADSSKQQLEKVLVYSRIKPAAADLQATIAMTGTPGDFIGPKDDRHLFYAVTTGEEQGWSVHKWNTLDNPHMRSQWEGELREIEERNPLYKDTADYKIMYLGEWAVDTSKIVYRFGEDRNLATTLPALTRWVIGVDLGWEDATAFSVGGWNEHDPNLYILRAYKQSKMTLDDVAAEIQKLRETYKNARIIVDGANKQAVETMRQRHSLPFEAAEKAGKADFIRMMNTDLVTGKVRLVEDMTVPLVDEWKSLVWDEDARIPTELSSCDNHLADATLYLWRFARNYLAKPEPPKKPSRSSEEAFEAAIMRRPGAGRIQPRKRGLL